MKHTLKNLDLLKISGEAREDSAAQYGRRQSAAQYGGDQDWFTEHWARMAGCGPCVTANLVSYFTRRETSEPVTREEFVRLMDDVFIDVVPPMGGIYTARLLTERTAKYFTRKGLKLVPTELVVPATELKFPEPPDFDGREERPPMPDFLPKPELGERAPFTDIAAYVAGTLDSDFPVCFLCLDCGAEARLDDWHWTTLVSFDDESFAAEVTDNGRLFAIDLKLWYDTTRMGGGFAAAMGN